MFGLFPNASAPFGDSAAASPVARYWVGGSGTWDTTTTTNWSTTSGGTGGASVPGAATPVFFDQAGTYTVTMTGALTCLDITVSAGTVTFATGTTPTIAISGSMSLVAGTVWSSTAVITFNATSTGKTITTNGTSLSGQITVSGIGGGWTLGSAFTMTGASMSILAGTFDTAGYALTCTQFVISGTNARTINLNSSTVTCSIANSTAFSAGTITNLTFNAGASQINLTGGGASGIASGGLTFYNVAFTSATVSSTRTITGANTFNNLAVTASSVAGTTSVTFDSPQTINGTLSTTGTAGNQRVFFASATYGIQQTLTVNSAPNLTDADFRDLIVTGTAAPISGTRIGNRGECSGITFSTPKTVYWNLAGAQNWSANGWAASSGGSPATTNFPLPQDTAVFDNTGSVTGTITLDTAIGYIGGINMSTRTSAMTLAVTNATTVYGNWTNGSGTTLTGTATLTFSGGTTQTITSSGKTFSCPITIDTYGGTVQLADALNIGSNSLTVNNGTFTTNGYAVSIGLFSSSTSSVRTINLNASTLTVVNGGSGFTISSTNLTFNAGTSLISFSANGISFSGGGVTFYNVSFANVSASSTHSITGSNTFNNLSVSPPSAAGVTQLSLASNQTINGTLTCAGASAVQRIFLQSSTIGTQVSLTANAISANDCDFRDIAIVGSASGASPTRAGDCGNNAGIVFPGAKTVYWNLAGAQNWSATGWATSSGGTPAVNNFPLAQDTAVFDNTGSVTGTITVNTSWNIGTLDMSARTSAMTLSSSQGYVYGDWKWGTGCTSSSTVGGIAFAKNGTQTITSNGIQFGCPITINNLNAYVQLADAISLGSTRSLTLSAGTFDAVTYNVTTGLFTNNATTNTLKMGSGTWTLSGTGTVWSLNLVPTIIAGTSTIVLSDTSTTARTFAGGGLYYNKLTIGGTTGTSTLTISGANTFGELASTKTVAHTITFTSSTTYNIGKWSVTGTAGNVVTLAPSTAATTYTLSINGPANSGIDYLSVSYCAVSTTSPGEFYVGANSTNTAGNTGSIIFAATPSPRTLYWVGGTGNWSSTTSWSTSSGGASGAAIPTSLDAVNFNSASNATAYTATVDAGVTIARCASFTMAGPASGNVTFAGTVAIAFHGSVSFAATGITRTYTGDMYWAGNSSYTFTTNGLALASAITVTGIGATWTLGSALNNGSIMSVTYGAFNTSNFSVTLLSVFSSTNSNIRSINLGSSTLSVTNNTATAFNFSTITNLTWSAGTSTLVDAASKSSGGFNGGGLTFYNVSFTGIGSTGSLAFTGANTFNTLSFAGQIVVTLFLVTFSANQTIGTLTLNAGTAAAYRTFLASNTIGTQRTLTVTTLTAGAADYDFRDIAVTGTASPLTGTRFGDCKGNSGITFPAAKTVYWNLAAGGNWNATGWAATGGGTPATSNFPLAQDTAIFQSTGLNSGSTVTVNANYNIGTIDMSARTSNTMTLATGATTPAIYGNWINGTGTTLSGTGTLTFAGRSSQTITNAGQTFTQPKVFNNSGGSVTLQDAYANSNTSTSSFVLSAGTIDANGYNVTLSGGFFASGSAARTLAVGSGTWTLAVSGSVFSNSATSITITGTGTISLTSASAKTFAGGGVSYSGITLNQGGAGALTISGNNTFANITNTSGVANSIALAATTQTLTSWTGAGTAGNLLTLSGTSAASPATLILSSGTANVDYLNISNVRAYPLTTTWYAGTHSTNSGGLGWIYASASGNVYFVTLTETATVTDSQDAPTSTYNATITEISTVTDSETATGVFVSAVSETATITDSLTGLNTMSVAISETSTVTDALSAVANLLNSLSETATVTDAVSTTAVLVGSISESSTATDTVSSEVDFVGAVSETATATDSQTSQVNFVSSLSETATVTDTESSAFVANSTTSETFTVTESVSFYDVLLGLISETSTVTDSVDGLNSMVALISETSTATDSQSAQINFVSALSESATITDSVAGLNSMPTTINETATITDSASTSAVFLGSVSETSTVTDVVTNVNSMSSSLSETATVTDSQSAQTTLVSSVSETATVTDSENAVLTLNLSVSETSVVYDLVTGLNSNQYVVNETVTLSDTVDASGSTYSAAQLETSTVTDSVVGLNTGNSSVSETSTVTDSISGLNTMGVSISEDSTVTDAVDVSNSMPVALTEVATITDSASTTAVFVSAVSETAVITDAEVNQLVLAASVNESQTVTDSVSSVNTMGVILYEAVSPADSYTLQANYGVSVSEASTVTDSFIGLDSISVTVSESSTATDSLSAYLLFNMSLSESSTVTDAVTSEVDFVAFVVETFLTTEVVSAGGSTYSTSLSETSTLTDSVSTAQTFVTAVSETATATDAVSANILLNLAVSETATVTDAVAALLILGLNITESVALLDSYDASGSTYGATVQEVATVTDQLGLQAIYYVAVAEALNLSDSIAGRLLWLLIDDSQTANWGIVNDAQTVSWNIVDDSQFQGGWQTFSTNSSQLTPYWSGAAASPTQVMLMNFSSAGGYLYSNNASSWLFGTLPFGGNVSRVGYINGQFFVYGSNIYKSADLKNWTQCTNPSVGGATIFMMGDGTNLVAVVGQYTYVSSNNGSSWTRSSTIFASSTSTRYDGVWDGSKYIFVSGRYVFTSTDGLSWTARVGPTVSSFSYIGCLAWNGSLFVATFYSDTYPTYSVVYTSSNGISWSQLTLPSFPRSTDRIIGVMWDGARFVMYCVNGNFYQLNVAINSTIYLGTQTNYTYPPNTPRLTVVKFNGVYVLPGFGVETATNGTFDTSADLSTFNVNIVPPIWSGIDDSQAPNWQNIPTS
jgi:trimeric autotransporter adhesin